MQQGRVAVGDVTEGKPRHQQTLSRQSEIWQRRTTADARPGILPKLVWRIMNSATIKLFLPRGDAKSLRTAEISNWTGKAIAAPRTELEELLQREELDKAGIYILTGLFDPLSGSPFAYIGEAEVIRERLKQHRSKEFWISAIVFVSKDENLTKAHVRYLESRLLAEAIEVREIYS